MIDGLLIDTGYAGTLRAFYKALKACEVRMEDIKYVMATHYHPDHAGIIGDLMEHGVKHLLVDVQRESVHTPSHSPDSISLILDNGDCFVGDLEPMGYSEAYPDNNILKEDWEHLLSFAPGRIYYAHRPEEIIENQR